jgi:hypothetical protein
MGVSSGVVPLVPRLRHLRLPERPVSSQLMRAVLLGSQPSQYARRHPGDCQAVWDLSDDSAQRGPRLAPLGVAPVDSAESGRGISI